MKILHRLWVSGEVYEPLRNSDIRKPRQHKLEIKLITIAGFG